MHPSLGQIPGSLWQNEEDNPKGSNLSMNISLTPELEQFVEETVKSGKLFGASEVICEALLLLQEQERLRQIRIENLR